MVQIRRLTLLRKLLQGRISKTVQVDPLRFNALTQKYLTDDLGIGKPNNKKNY